MIGRLLASAAFAAILSGAALAQMPPPPANPGPAGSSSQMNSGSQAGASHTGSSGQAGGNHTNTNASPSTSAGGRASSGPTSLNHQANRNSTMSGDRQTAQGRPDVAEKLNACEAKPMKERQACISDATRGM